LSFNIVRTQKQNLQLLGRMRPTGWTQLP